MSPRRIACLLLPAWFLGACGPATGEFGAPRVLGADKRPTRWDEPDKVRLRTQRRTKNTAPLSYTAATPTGWESLAPQPSRFRDLVWRVAGDSATECYLTALAGGTVEQNLARWFSQFGSQPQPLASLPRIEMAGESGHLLELAGEYLGKPGQAMLLAFLVRDEEGVTTLKLTGPEAVVKQQRAEFLGLVGSLRAEGTSTSPPVASNASPSDRYEATTPVGFEVMPPQPGRFRDLLWRVAGVPETECFLTAFAGGSIESNLNRWYGQFGLTTQSLASLPRIEMAGEQGYLLELAGAYEGTADRAMALGFVVRDQGVTTLKFLGPTAIVKQHRDAFLSIAKSLRRSSAPPQPVAPAGPAAPHAGPDPAAPFTAAVPAGWTPKPGSARPLHHTIGAEGEMYVSQLGGNMRAMIDIWRSEVGLKAATDDEWAAVGKLPMLGGEAFFLDVSGDYRGMTGKQIANGRLLVGAHQDGTAIIFAKLFGPAAEVAEQVDTFKSFCGSLRRTP